MKKNTLLIALALFVNTQKTLGANPPIGCDPPPKVTITIKPLALTPTGINELTEALSNISTKVKLSPFKYERGGDIKFNGTTEIKEECCDNVVVPISTLKVSGNIPFGKFSANAIIPLVPGISAFAQGSVSLDINGTGSAKGDCSKPYPNNLCVSFGGAIKGEAKLGLALGHPDAININGALTVTGSMSGEWCNQGGLKDKEVCLTVTGSATIETFLGDIELWSDELYKDCV
jgi:hypothetical protein